MKAWEIVKRVCQIPSVEVEGLALRLRLGQMTLGTVMWEDHPAIDCKQSHRPLSFTVDFGDSTLNNYGKNKLIVDLFEALKNEPDTEAKEEELNKPPEVAT